VRAYVLAEQLTQMIINIFIISAVANWETITQQQENE